MIELNLANLAKEEVRMMDFEKVNLEVKEYKMLTLQHSKEIIELDKQKSEIYELVKPDVLQVMPPHEKDEMIRRTSTQIEHSSFIVK